MTIITIMNSMKDLDLLDKNCFMDCLNLCNDINSCNKCYYCVYNDKYIDIDNPSLYGEIGFMKNNYNIIDWIEMFKNFIYFGSIIFGTIGFGCYIAFVIVGQFIYKPIKNEFQAETFKDYVDYEEKYDKEFNDLIESCNDKECDKYIHDYIFEQTPNGLVIMTFNKEEDVFEYYTDKKRYISYYHLETVAKRFVIENECKSIFKTKNKSEEYVKTDVDCDETNVECDKDDVDCDNDDVDCDNDDVNKKDNMFVSLKSYNKVANKLKDDINDSKNYKVDNKKANSDMNVYKFIGKIEDYKEFIKEDDNDKKYDNVINDDADWSVMSFADYKKMKNE